MDDEQKVLELIEQAAKEGWTELDLSAKLLTSLPSKIAELTKLTALNLSYNLLTSLPAEIIRLTNLTSLYLGSNQLKRMPSDIEELRNLTSLDLNRNQLTSLPREIATLTNLNSLDLTNNQLTTLPPEIINLTNLASLDLSNNELTSVPPEVINLTNLTSLALSNNLLTSLPPEIVRLAKLTRLHLGGVQLSIAMKIGWGVSGNRLTRIPTALFTLTKLVDLDLGWNELTGLAPEIANLTNLTGLRLRRNQFKSVPDGILQLTNLAFLDLSGNQLTSVPPEITKLIKLTSLDLRETQLPIPPETLGNPFNVKAIFAAIVGLKGEERLNEAKMLVVGDGSVGKTSVVKQLIHPGVSTQARHEEVQPRPYLRILRIVVASPSDVQPERDLLPGVIEEVNRHIAADRGLHLILTRWETDTHPGFNPEGPQGLIDPILKITDCDVLIGVFWKRIGTPTADGTTGTEHEFTLAYEAWKEKGRPQIFVYFNQTPDMPKSKAEAAQWGQVLEFRERFPKEGLWWPYEGKAQFETLVRNHLMTYIRGLTDF